MSAHIKQVALKDAPLTYAPTNELGVVYMFASIAKKLQFRIEAIHPSFPDCIAYRRIGNQERRMRIEFEYQSRNFVTHGHSTRKCDAIVCWHHNWFSAPKHIEIFELKRLFGAEKNVWFIQALKTQQQSIDRVKVCNWSMSRQAVRGDLMLMYRCSPVSAVTDVFEHISPDGLQLGEAGWREGEAYYGKIRKICHLDAPIHFSDMKNHRVIKNSTFVRRSMQGPHNQATEYWPYLYESIIRRNPSVKRVLEKWSPERL
jgi:hypothetical protein